MHKYHEYKTYKECPKCKSYYTTKVHVSMVKIKEVKDNLALPEGITYKRVQNYICYACNNIWTKE